MSMWLKPDARPDVIRVIIHHVPDRHGRYRFLTTRAGRAICVSHNPLTCTALALLDEGRDPMTPILFRDAETEDEELLTLQEAAECRLAHLGEVLPFRKAVQR